MGSSPDVGGRHGLGKPLMPEPYEIETRAETVVAKAGLSMISNTLDIPFSQLGGLLGRKPAESSKPTLQQFVLRNVVHPDREGPSILEKKYFEQLTKGISLKLFLALKEESKKPVEERDPRFDIFQRILRFAAKALSWLDEIKQIEPDQREERTKKNKYSPYILLVKWIKVAKNLGLQLQREQGDFKEINLSDTIFIDNIQLIKNLLKKAMGIIEAKDKSQLDALKDALQSTEILSSRYKKGELPNLLKIVANLMESFLSILSCLSFRGGSSLILPVHFLHKFFSSGEKPEDRFIGTREETLFSLIHQRYPNWLESQKQTFKNLSEFFLIVEASTILQAAGVETSPNHLTGNLREEQNALKILSFNLASTLITESKVFQNLLSHLMRELGIEEIDAKLSGNLSPLILSLFFAYSTQKSQKSLPKISPFLEGLKVEMLENLKNIREEIDSGALKGVPSKFSIAISQAILSLERGDEKAFFEAARLALSEIKLTEDGLIDEGVITLSHLLAFLHDLRGVKEQEQFTSYMSQSA